MSRLKLIIFKSRREIPSGQYLMLILHGSKEDGRLVFLYDFVGSFVSLFGLPAYLLSNTIARKEANSN